MKTKKNRKSTVNKENKKWGNVLVVLFKFCFVFLQKGYSELHLFIT